MGLNNNIKHSELYNLQDMTKYNREYMRWYNNQTVKCEICNLIVKKYYYKKHLKNRNHNKNLFITNEEDYNILKKYHFVK